MRARIIAAVPLSVEHITHDGWYGHAIYEVTDTPDNLVRTGIAAPAPTKTGLTPCGKKRASGLVTISEFAHNAIRRDSRFRAALDRVLRGEACPDVSLPPAPKRKQRAGDRGDAQGAAS